MANDEIETTEVLICGCGPTGALLSAILSQQGVSNVCLDREASIVTDPRGIALDEDGIRALQSIGILDKVYSEIGRCMGIFNFVGGMNSDFSRKPFMRLDYGTSEGGTGHVGFICHKQPTLEKHIRRKIEDSHFSQLRTSCTLDSIREDQDWVYATYVDNQYNKHEIRAKFLVGADGKTGFTRKKYLEPRGVLMQQISDV
jgi:2-polyprenyl-6-methoxyphenol hydroxylase-like FAD-dependent oxidoreductase